MCPSPESGWDFEQQWNSKCGTCTQSGTIGSPTCTACPCELLNDGFELALQAFAGAGSRTAGIQCSRKLVHDRWVEPPAAGVEPPEVAGEPTSGAPLSTLVPGDTHSAHRDTARVTWVRANCGLDCLHMRRKQDGVRGSRRQGSSVHYLSGENNCAPAVHARLETPNALIPFPGVRTTFRTSRLRLDPTRTQSGLSSDS